MRSFQLALWLRGKIRNLANNRKLTQHGRLTAPIIFFLESLLDLHHQETFYATRHNRFAQRWPELEDYNVPEYKSNQRG